MVEFSKYQGLGNDFILIELRDKESEYEFLYKNDQFVKAICDRRFGIGADGVIYVLAPRSNGDVKMKILNSDGTEGDHLRWRLQGLLQLNANKQRKISKRNLISQVIRTYYKNDEEQMKKILLNV